MQSAVRKAIAAVIGFLVALALLLALSIGGIYLLGKAATLAMTPYLGEAGAMAVTGLLCLLLLVMVLHRLARSGSSRSSHRASDAGPPRSVVRALREVIRENPLESAFTAFAIGVVEHSDPGLKSFILESGVAFVKQRNTETQADTDADDPDSGLKPDP
jgi:hypothetical protein